MKRKKKMVRNLKINNDYGVSLDLFRDSLILTHYIMRRFDLPSQLSDYIVSCNFFGGKKNEGVKND